jgi:hypothetical protein
MSEFFDNKIEQERIRNAAPELLEALDRIICSSRAIHIDEEAFYLAVKAVKKAKGEL